MTDVDAARARLEANARDARAVAASLELGASATAQALNPEFAPLVLHIVGGLMRQLASANAAHTPVLQKQFQALEAALGHVTCVTAESLREASAGHLRALLDLPATGRMCILTGVSHTNAWLESHAIRVLKPTYVAAAGCAADDDALRTLACPCVVITDVLHRFAPVLDSVRILKAQLRTDIHCVPAFCSRDALRAVLPALRTAVRRTSLLLPPPPAMMLLDADFWAVKPQDQLYFFDTLPLKESSLPQFLQELKFNPFKRESKYAVARTLFGRYLRWRRQGIAKECDKASLLRECPPALYKSLLQDIFARVPASAADCGTAGIRRLVGVDVDVDADADADADVDEPPDKRVKTAHVAAGGRRRRA
jgi:hypothetical protein